MQLFDEYLEHPSAERKACQANTLLAQFMAVEENGHLAQRIREVATSNRSKAAKPRKTATRPLT
jgi:hypothetical protein